MQKYMMWIDGKWVDAKTGKTFGVVNPANGEEFARVSLGGKAEVDMAVEAAKKAFPTWSVKTQAERSGVLFKIADAMREKVGELAELESRDHGFPISQVKNVVQGSVGIFEYAAQCAMALMSDVIPSRKHLHLYLRREPVGVTALITPWNVPLNIVAHKIAYSLAVGNTCVIKPATADCLTALKLAEILEGIDLPPGTVNFVTGPGAEVGEYLAAHAGVNMVSFTGSSETGKAIMAAASGTVKRIQLELGGKNPFVVMEDYDVDAAIAVAVPGVMFNSGQVCGSPGRFYVHDKIYDDFVSKFVAAAAKMVVGDPADERTEMGPLASAEHRDRVEGYIKSGIDEGATLKLGGKRPANPPLDKGYYVMPTVFSDVQQRMKIAREEIFGPVACILKFSSEEEVVKLANDSSYGLSASVWTKDTARGMRMAEEIQAGAVWVNSTPAPLNEAPWGGFKESGVGKQYAMIGFDDVTQLKVIAVNIAQQ
jgi:acyl-CoA reductase-like NAD-dependent aldehyde dehydrogenase